MGNYLKLVATVPKIFLENRELKYFNIIDGFPLDLMHDFLEGVLVYNFGMMMKCLIDDQLLSFETFENDPKIVPSYMLRLSHSGPFSMLVFISQLITCHYIYLNVSFLVHKANLE